MASPIVKKVLDRLEGERELKILESNNEIKQPKLWARAKKLAEQRHKVYSPDAHGWAIRWYQQKGGIFECLVTEHHQKDADGNEIPHDIEEAKKAKKNADRKDRGDQEEFERAQEYIKKTPTFGKVNEAATTRIPAQNGNVYELMYSWRGKTYFCKMFFPQPNKPSKKEVQTALNQVYPSAILRNCVISAVNYGDPYIHVGQGDGFTGKATGY